MTSLDNTEINIKLICKYSIIEFEDGSIEIIPKTWFLDEKHTYFPNNTLDRIKYDRYVLKMIEPNPEWEIFSITKIIASEDNFQSLRKKLKTAEFHSDLEATEQTKKRRKVHAAKFFESSDEEMVPKKKNVIHLPNIPKMDDDLSTTAAVTKLQNTAEPEKTTLAFWNGEQWTPLGTDQVNTTNFSEMNASYNLNELNMDSICVTSTPVKSHVNEVMLPLTPNLFNHSGSELINNDFLSNNVVAAHNRESELNKNTSITNQNLNINVIKNNDNIGMDQIMKLLNKIADDVSIMKTDLADIQITVARLLTKDTSVMSIRSKMLSLNLPKTSLDELEALESNLNDSQLEKDLEFHLVKTGIADNSKGKSINRWLASVMTNNVATNFNIEGKGTKKGFIHYKISNIIRDVSYALQKTTDKEYKDALGAWLRQANKRIKNKINPKEVNAHIV